MTVSESLLAAGLLGALLMLVYLRACAWADWELLPSRVRRRVYFCSRQAPVVFAGSGTLAVVGLTLGVLA